jgi:superfamily II DNA helicase RecQ
MFGKYNGFVSKARVSACMYFLVNLLRGEDVIATLPTGHVLIFRIQLYIIAKSKLATCQHEQGSNISYSCLVICPLESIIQDQIAEATSLGIAVMKLDDDFKNNTSKHAHLLFATAEYVYKQPAFILIF